MHSCTYARNESAFVQPLVMFVWEGNLSERGKHTTTTTWNNLALKRVWTLGWWWWYGGWWVMEWNHGDIFWPGQLGRKHHGEKEDWAG